MNVELCISIFRLIKYLFKYICRCPDGVTVEKVGSFENNPNANTLKGVPIIDEIGHYQDVCF